MHFFTMLLIAGGALSGWHLYKRWRLQRTSGTPTGGFIVGRNPGTSTSQNTAVNNAAHRDAGDGEPTNVYDAVIGIAEIAGGTINTALSDATGEVADDVSDVVDRTATARSEHL